MPKGSGRPKTSVNKGANKNEKLRLFQGSSVANKRGAAFNPSGSIMRRSDAVGSTAPIGGVVRSKYGVSKREPVYDYGFGSSKLKGAVAQKKPKGK